MSPNFTFRHWKKTSRKDFQTGFQPKCGHVVRGAQQRANINAISGGWDKKGGVDNGCFGQSVNRYTRYYCATPAIVPLLNVLVCSKSLGFTTRKNCLFYMIWLHLHDNRVASWEDIAINSSWDVMHNFICVQEGDSFRNQSSASTLMLEN